ncbi:putative proteasome subunit alpha type-3 [Cucumispora dikerogammari]|nr:putative proteasome subunit alpha type-3 [Cucumispora dikerogammari]
MADESAKSNIFNEQGRILQTENAIKNVANAGVSMSILCSDGILMIGHNATKNNEELEKIVQIDKHIYAIFSGIFADALQVISFMRNEAQNHLKDFDTSIPIAKLIIEASCKLQAFTQTGGQRPFGCSFLLCTYEDDEYQIYSIDPSGNFNKWECKSFGNNHEKFQSAFNQDKYSDKTLQTVTEMIFKVLKEVSEFPKSEAKKFEVLHFRKDKKMVLSETEIEDLIVNA